MSTPTSKECAPPQRNVATSASDASACSSLAAELAPASAVGRVASGALPAKLSCRGADAAPLGAAVASGAIRDGEIKPAATDEKAAAAAVATAAAARPTDHACDGASGASLSRCTLGGVERAFHGESRRRCFRFSRLLMRRLPGGAGRWSSGRRRRMGAGGRPL